MKLTSHKKCKCTVLDADGEHECELNMPLYMYIIRRKEDGFYYNSRWRRRKDEARLFKSLTSAKCSRGWKNYKIVKTKYACAQCAALSEKDHIRSPYYHTYYGKSIKYFENRHNRKPCWKKVTLTDEENPLEILKVKVELLIQDDKK